MKKDKKQLINNIIGQLNGINKMIEDDKDCFEVIIQMKAVKSAFNSLLLKFCEENLMECSQGVKNKNKKNMEKLLKEIIKN